MLICADKSLSSHREGKITDFSFLTTAYLNASPTIGPHFSFPVKICGSSFLKYSVLFFIGKKNCHIYTYGNLQYLEGSHSLFAS